MGRAAAPGRRRRLQRGGRGGGRGSVLLTGCGVGVGGARAPAGPGTRGRRSSPGACEAALPREACARAALRRLGAGRPGRGARDSGSRGLRQFRAGVSRSLPRGPLLSGVSPLLSPSFPPSRSPPPPSSRLLQCGGCGYLVYCPCGPSPRERCLLGFQISGSQVV